ncbi:MAG: DUF2344 domain-containing protein [Planctomycetes bacterium]|nr:DUF2344 domain-containing protein [Planctomycetota bacterium]
MNRFLYRLRFAKTGRARFFSHHDILRGLERALRRAGLPLSLSEGYNPRPRITFLSALSLGVESLDEWVEVELSEGVEAAEVGARLSGQLPGGIEVLEAAAAEGRMAAVAAAYEAELPEGAAPDAAAILARERIVVERKAGEGTREVDIRPWIESVRVAGRKAEFTIRITDSGSARPEELLRLLGAPGARVVRVKTVLAARK